MGQRIVTMQGLTLDVDRADPQMVAAEFFLSQLALELKRNSNTELVTAVRQRLDGYATAIRDISDSRADLHYDNRISMAESHIAQAGFALEAVEGTADLAMVTSGSLGGGAFAGLSEVYFGAKTLATPAGMTFGQDHPGAAIGILQIGLSGNGLAASQFAEGIFSLVGDPHQANTAEAVGDVLLGLGNMEGAGRGPLLSVARAYEGGRRVLHGIDGVVQESDAQENMATLNSAIDLQILDQLQRLDDLWGALGEAEYFLTLDEEHLQRNVELLSEHSPTLRARLDESFFQDEVKRWRDLIANEAERAESGSAAANAYRVSQEMASVAYETQIVASGSMENMSGSHDDTAKAVSQVNEGAGIAAENAEAAEAAAQRSDLTAQQSGIDADASAMRRGQAEAATQIAATAADDTRARSGAARQSKEDSDLTAAGVGTAASQARGEAEIAEDQSALASADAINTESNKVAAQGAADRATAAEGAAAAGAHDARVAEVSAEDAQDRSRESAAQTDVESRETQQLAAQTHQGAGLAGQAASDAGEASQGSEAQARQTASHAQAASDYASVAAQSADIGVADLKQIAGTVGGLQRDLGGACQRAAMVLAMEPGSLDLLSATDDAAGESAKTIASAGAIKEHIQQAADFVSHSLGALEEIEQHLTMASSRAQKKLDRIQALRAELTRHEARLEDSVAQIEANRARVLANAAATQSHAEDALRNIQDIGGS